MGTLKNKGSQPKMWGKYNFMPFQNAFVSSPNLCQDTINKKGKGIEKWGVNPNRKKEGGEKKKEGRKVIARRGKNNERKLLQLVQQLRYPRRSQKSVASGGMKVQFTAAMGWTWSAS